MTDILMILFLLFVLSLIVLDISMIISLIKPGDERKQMVVWKASAYTLLAAVGAMVINIIHNIIQTDAMQIQSIYPACRYRHHLLFLSVVLQKAVWWLSMENIIRARRKELHLSQEELAKKCGVSRQTINAIENNKYDPTLALAFRLAKELQLTVDSLFRPT